MVRRVVRHILMLLVLVAAALQAVSGSVANSEEAHIALDDAVRAKLALQLAHKAQVVAVEVAAQVAANASAMAAAVAAQATAKAGCLCMYMP